MADEQGKCPKCGSDNLSYGNLEPMDDSIYYPYICGQCEFKGKEWYNLHFSGHWDTDGNEL